LVAHSFFLQQRVYAIACSDEKERSEWMEAIQQQISQLTKSIDNIIV
jgi:hypothetical protein